MDLENKTVLITGSTDGLGKALAIKMISLGAKVIVHGRDVNKVEKVKKEIGAFSSIVYDFNKETGDFDLKNVVDNLDILINNAGVWLEGDTIQASDLQIRELSNVNLLSYMLTVRNCLPALQKSSFSQILNISSVAGVEIPFDYFHTYYTATKYGVQGFTEALAKEFFNKNIRVMGFYPGGMETELFSKAGLDYAKHEPWMFEVNESVDAIIFMLTRSPKVNIKRLDLINQLLQ